MAGLETIAMAVAHLERLKDDDDDEEDNVTSSSPQVVSEPVADAVPSPAPGVTLQTRMVSTDTSSTARRSPVDPPASQEATAVVAASAPRPPAVTLPTDRRPTSPQQQARSDDATSSLQPSSVLAATASAGMGGPVAVLLNAIASVTDNLDEFFLLMNQLEQVALAAEPTGKAADVPKADEAIVNVQRNDVLLGRGGETNHHIGNIQYRQLVKACQPAYLAAKRRDKPRIAAAIVGVVRARSGRFCKKHASDNVWRDVGNVRAREKTSQALREGAPELRGTVEASRTQLLQEAVASSRAQRLFEANEVCAMVHPTQSPHDVRHLGVHAPPDPRGPPPPPGVEYHLHPPMYYAPHPHAPGPKFMYHHPPPMTLEQQQHYAMAYNGKRPMPATGTASPPPKRPATVGKSSPTVAPTAPVTAPRVWPPAETSVSAAVSAEHSEEEPPAVHNPPRAASPASSTSSKGSASNRGPRVKLLKNRLEDAVEAV